MKTTLEIDDALYREAKAFSALTGRKMKDLVSDGLRRVLHPPEGSVVLEKDDNVRALAELRQWFKAADKAMKNAPAGPTARELLDSERGRLEKP